MALHTPQHKYTFPPFPSPPEGVKIFTFKDFDETAYAIKAVSKDHTKEVDAQGVETVVLNQKKRELDRRKTNKKDTGFSGKVANTLTASGQQWAERFWSDGENYRFVSPGSCSATATLEERLSIAYDHFEKGRKWPTDTQRHTYKWMAEIFSNFTGLRQVNPNAATNPPREEDDDYDDDVDFEDEFAGSPAPEPEPTNGVLPVDAEDHPVSLEPILPTRNLLAEFASDIPGQIRTFLSAYLEDKNYNGVDYSLIGFPTLIRYFLDFIARSRILRGPKEEKLIASAQDYCELALVELPLTLRVARELPEDVGRAGAGVWGRGLNRSDPSAAKDGDKAANRWGTAVPEDAPAEEHSNNDWGDTVGTGWGVEEGIGTWGTGSENGLDEEANPVGDEEPAPKSNPISAWFTNTPTFTQFLGPLAGDIGLSHTLCVSEVGMRKITQVFGPGESLPAAGRDSELSEFDHLVYEKMGRVVMSLWTGWCDEEEWEDKFRHPRVEAAIDPNRTDGFVWGSDPEEANDTTEVSEPAAPTVDFDHDPTKDDIIQIIDPALVSLFKEAVDCVGFGAVWVQMVPKEGNKGQRWWYMEDVVRVIPSFYSAKGMVAHES